MQTETIHSSERGRIELVYGEEKLIRRTVYSENTVYNALKYHRSEFLPKIYSVEVGDGETVVCEEYIDGESPARTQLSAKKAEEIMLQLCSALEAIHRLGIVHRDIKPSNILLGKDGRIRLIDFEAARIFKDDSENDTCCLGTKGFAPPEQYGFAQTDYRADIYAAGQTMKIFFGDNAEKPRYKKIIQRCTALDPEKRYQSASELKRALVGLQRRKTVISILSAAALTAAVCIFARINVSRDVPAYTEATSAQTVTASQGITETEQVVSETEQSLSETVTVQTSARITSEAETTEMTTASGVIVGNEISYPEFSEEKITYVTDPENMPEYDSENMIFFCEDKNAKIFLADGNGLFGRFEQYLMHTDLDGDGLAEMAAVGVDINGRLEIEIVTGKIIDGAQRGVLCFDFVVPYEFDKARLGKDTFVQLTEFELGGDGILAVTIGNKENYNFTGFFTVKDDEPKFLGNAWGETYARVVGTALSEYLKGGGNNLYGYAKGKLTAVTAYDYAEYSAVNYGGASLEEIFEYYAN